MSISSKSVESEKVLKLLNIDSAKKLARHIATAMGAHGLSDVLTKSILVSLEQVIVVEL